MNIAIIGAGDIVSGFLESQKDIQKIRVVAICGLLKDKDNMEHLCKQYSIPSIYFDYNEVLQRKDIDVIYLAVPNIYHYDYAIKAIEHHKHTIVEKPFTVNYSQAVSLAKKAKESEIIVFEAISNQYESMYLKIIELLPSLGDIKTVNINYSVFSKRYTAFKEGSKIYPAFDLKTGGGVLMDMGVYCIYFLIGLFGKPLAYKYYPRKEKGVDTSGVIIFEYKDFISVCVLSKDSHGESKIQIQSDLGYISSNSDVNYIADIRLRLYEQYEIIKEENYYDDKKFARLYDELIYFINMVENKDYKSRDSGLDKSLTVMEIINDFHKQNQMS